MLEIENDFHDNEKPQRARKLPFPLLFLAISLIIGGGTLMGWLVLRHQETPPGSRTNVSVPQQTTSVGGNMPNVPAPPVSFPAAYIQVVKEQIAQRFHIPMAQLRTELLGTVHNNLNLVARGHGISPGELPAVLVEASQMASDQMVRTGIWTQAQSTANMQYWSSLEQDATHNVAAYKQKSSIINNWLMA